MSDLVKPKQLGVELQKTEAVLAQWRYLGRGPRFVKVGRSVRYRRQDIDAWLDEQTMQRTGYPVHGDHS